MKKLIFLLAVAAAVAGAVGFRRRKEASELWGSATDTVTSWGEPVTTKAEEVAETAVQAAQSAASEVRDAAPDAGKKAKDVAEQVG